jgi:hypothetical protein
LTTQGHAALEPLCLSQVLTFIAGFADLIASVVNLLGGGWARVGRQRVAAIGVIVRPLAGPDVYV